MERTGLTQTWCGKRASAVVEAATQSEPLVCARVVDHGGLHRNTPTRTMKPMVEWGDNECA